MATCQPAVSWRLFAALLTCLQLSGYVAGQQCRVSYNWGERPLLFGGTGDPGRCQGPNCQTRDDYWGKACAYQSGSAYGVCTTEQARTSLEVAKTLGGGAIMNLSPCDLMPYLKGRTLWIIGDSHAKSLYRAVQCFLIDFWNHQECESSTDSTAVSQLYNLPGAPGQSYCFHLLGDSGGRVCVVHVVLGTSLVDNQQLPHGGVLPLLSNKFAKPQDIFYINFGVWHKKLTEWENSYKVALNALGKYYRKTKSKWPHMMFRETPAEHKRNPAWDGCLAARGWYYNAWSGGLEVEPSARSDFDQSWQLGVLLNSAARDILGKYKLPVVAGFNSTVPLWDNHLGKHMTQELDCLHYCQPGAPQMWVWYLYDAMRQGKAKIRPLPSSKKAKFKYCIKSKQSWLN